MPDPSFEDVLALLRERDDVAGAYLFGSRGRDVGVDARSDWDLCVVLSDDAARDRFRAELPYVHGAVVELVSTTLDGLRANISEHGRYAAAHAEVVLDRTSGELARLVEEQEALPAGTRDSVVRESLDDYANSTYRSLRYGTALDALEAIPYALRAIFALAGRVRPYNKYLEWELRNHPLPGCDADELLALIDAVATGGAAAQHALFRWLEAKARAHGFGAALDEWQPDLEWLRGDAGYRPWRAS
jgi:predicted nucleotidyltransferase